MNEIEAAQFSEEGPELAAQHRQGAGGAQVGKIHGRTPSAKDRRTPRFRSALGDRPVRFAPKTNEISCPYGQPKRSLRLQQDYTRGFNSSRIRVKRPMTASAPRLLEAALSSKPRSPSRASPLAEARLVPQA